MTYTYVIYIARFLSGPWAPFVDEVKYSRPSDEQKAILDEWATRKEPTANTKVDNDEKTSLHIQDTHDYQGLLRKMNMLASFVE